MFLVLLLVFRTRYSRIKRKKKEFWPLAYEENFSDTSCQLLQMFFMQVIESSTGGQNWPFSHGDGDGDDMTATEK